MDCVFYNDIVKKKDQGRILGERFKTRKISFCVKNAQVIYPSEKNELLLDPMGESSANMTRHLETTWYIADLIIIIAIM